MRKNTRFGSSNLLIVILLGLTSPVMAQVDTAKPVPVDTTAKTLTIDEKGKKKNEFILYGGANINQLNISSNQFDATSSLGYHLGVAYKQGKFFYWQVGARYNNAQYNFVSKANSRDSGKITVRAIDLPLTVGVNVLSFINRLSAVRAFVSAVPSFNLGVGDNNLNFTKDNINKFIFYGQAGIGVNVAFVVIEVGYNYGFQNLLKNYSSNPGQAFVSLGFRF